MNDKIKSLLNVCGMPNEDLMEIYSDENKTFYMEKFAELIINKHLSIWEQMDNGNAVAGYVEMEDYPKAILKYFGIEE